MQNPTAKRRDRSREDLRATGFMLPEAMIAALHQAAARAGKRSASSIAREALGEWLRRTEAARR